jgi:DNA-binding NtrC family response regulator
MAGPAHILVVDDELIVRELVAGHFRNRGFTVSMAENGKAALTVMSRHHIDILIVDLQMPVMDGHELLAAVRVQHPFARAIVLTGCATFENVLATLEAGAFSFVTKPLTTMEPLDHAVDQALTVLRTWLEQLAALQRLKSESIKP